MNEPRAARPGDRRARTRDQLLVAAQTLLLDREAGPLGIRRITTAAGLVHGSFYNYYPDLDALLDDLAALMFASHAALVSGPVSTIRPSLSP
ncbi:MAG TPA: TetR/AcrR family transcriptional regulator [Caulobacter sp.]|nr:TetR/AcrR family transcriptional regulator [Caulobacter sp.]